MSRWVKWIPLVLIAAAIGLLLGILVPREPAEPNGQVHTLTFTSTIPPAQP